MKRRRLLLVGDLHVGSEWGIFPDEFETEGRNKIALNSLQQELLNCWDEMIDDIKKDIDTVILMGDLANGLSKKEFGKHQVVSDFNEQIKACISLLEPLTKSKKVVGVSGSKYHMSVDYEIDQHICDKLNGTFVGPVANLDIKDTNIRLNVTHGGGSAPQYLGTKMAKEILQSLIAYSLDKIPDVQVICRAHHHTYAILHTMGKHFVLNPCWEGARLDSHSAPHYFRYQPDIGSVMIEIEGDEVNLFPYLYTIKNEGKSIIRI